MQEKNQKLSSKMVYRFKKAHLALLAILTAASALTSYTGYVVVRNEIFKQVESQVARIVRRANTHSDLVGLQRDLNEISIPFGTRFPTDVEVFFENPIRIIARYSSATMGWNSFLIVRTVSVENKFLGTLMVSTKTDFSELWYTGFVVVGLGLAFLFGIILTVEQTRTIYLKSLLTGFDLVLEKIGELPSQKALDSGGLAEAEEIQEAVNRLANEISRQKVELSKAVADEAAERHSREIDRIASQVAHDIRSPLAVLKVLSNSIGDVEGGKKEMLRTAIDRINGIATQLLDQKRERKIGAGVGSEEAIPVLKTVQEVVRDKEIEYSKHQADLVFEVSHNKEVQPDHLIQISPLQFGAALSNLINNAVEAVLKKRAGVPESENGQSVIRVRVELSQVEAVHSVVVSIEDRGCGIPQEIIEKLGLPGLSFGKAKGSGIGFYSAKKTVIDAGGTFSVQSQVGVGTRITLSLPIF